MLSTLRCWVTSRIGLSLLALSLPVLSLAQTAEPTPCGTEQVMREVLGAGYDQWWQQHFRQLQQMQARHRPQAQHRTTANRAAHSPAGPRLILPVVVHIIYDSPGNNIADDQVADAVRLLNEMYQERHPDTSQVIPHFKSRIGNVNLEFRLARLDPSGDCTTGITRHFSPLASAADEQVKNLPGANWPSNRYVNIWVVANIANGAAGYALYPCAAPNREGLVIRNDYFGSIGTTPDIQSRRYTFPHEIGHYLGLPHVWGSTNTPGPGLGNCNIDDGVEDTPNTEGTVNGTCNLLLPACPGDPDSISNVQNVMDYSGGCRAMFTAGQATLMNDGVNGAFSCRSVLATAQNLTLTGVADGQIIAPCLPIPMVTAATPTPGADVQMVCNGDSIRFQGQAFNLPAGTPVTFHWRFPGGSPATSTSQTPMVRYATPGLYDVVLRVATPSTADSTKLLGYVNVRNTTGGLTTPQVVTFDNPAFPIDPTDPLKSWEISPEPGTDITWEQTNVAAAQGSGSVRLPLVNTATGQDYDLVSPNIIIGSTLQRPYVYFSNAYARSSAASSDRLTFSYSFDCGRNWITRGASAIRQAPALQTAPPSVNLFVPTATQWRRDSILIQNQPLLAGTSLRIRFRATSDEGSALYLDEFSIGRPLTGLAPDHSASPAALHLSPNPTDGQATLHVVVPPSTTGRLRLCDATGRWLGQAVAVRGGDQVLTLPEVAGRLAPGVYLLELTLGNGSRLTKRVLVL